MFVGLIEVSFRIRAVPGFRQLVAGLSPRRDAVSIPRQSIWDLWWTKWQ